MNIASALVVAAEEGHHDPLAVMMQTMPAGLIALTIFAVLALVVSSFRHVANRHAPKAEAFAARNQHDAHGAGH